MEMKPNNELRTKLSRKQIGQLGEDWAAEYLIEQGYTLITRNWRCRSGEIDMIAQIDHVLVFVEVRTRSSRASFGTAEESLNYRKQKQVRETAQFYLLQNKGFNRKIRFDAITVFAQLSSGNPKALEVNHIQSAF